MTKNWVLITGSGRGLGKSLALVFASNNYDIILHDRVTEDLENTRNEILEKGVNCDILLGDLNDIETIDKLYDVAKNKDVSILINNAGLHCPHLPLERIKDDQIDEIITTNLISQIKLTKRMYSVFLEKNNGVIININSMSGLKSSKNRTIYSASKWGLRGFSESFKLEAENHNIRIIDVYPSRIKTRPEFKYGMESDDVAKKIYDAYKDESKETIEIT